MNTELIERVFAWIKLIILICCFGGCYYIMNGASFKSRPNCIRVKFNGQVVCECDYKTKEEFQELKNNMKPDEWEGVIFDDDKDPCEISRKLKEEFNSNEQTESNNYENQELTTQEYPQNSYVENEPDTSEVESEPEQPTTPETQSFPAPLPRTYYSGSQKITLFEDGGLKLDIYTFADSSSSTFSAEINNGEILLDNSSAFFQFNKQGELWLKFPDTQYIPLSSVPIQ